MQRLTNVRAILSLLAPLLIASAIAQFPKQVLGSQLDSAGLKAAPHGPAPAEPKPAARTDEAAHTEHTAHTANYDIMVSLDTGARKASGHMVIQFSNTSDAPLSALYFHLYLNAFEHENTLFLRNPSRSGNRLTVPGGIEVKTLSSSRFPNRNLWEDAQPHSPGDPEDRTDIRVDLPEALQPNERVVFELAFVARIPEVVERTGFRDSFYLMGQWYPKLAKLEQDGSWAHFAYHPYGEFYANFGDYRVTIDVPSAYVVGSTGHLEALPGSRDGRTRYHAIANHVIDFAWTAWDGFEVDEFSADGIKVRLLSPRGTQHLRQEVKDTLIRGLTYLGNRYGRYPYSQLTAVLPPAFASSAGGMEYPQFITLLGQALAPFTGAKISQLITFHELTHQWFQSTIASNEHRYPFLDEGITAYVEWEFLDDDRAGLIAWPGLSISRLAAGRYAHFRQSQLLPAHHSPTPIVSAAPNFISFNELASVIYSRTPLCLTTLARVYGATQLDQALQSYARKYKFAHPGPTALLGEIATYLGADARKQAQLMFENNGELNLSLASVTSAKSGTSIASKISVKHEGTLTLPYAIRVTFSDQSRTRIEGKADAQTKEYQLHHQQPIIKVELDPEHDILLDSNLFDNRGYFESSSQDTRPARLDLAQPRSKLRSAIFSWLSWILQVGAG